MTVNHGAPVVTVERLLSDGGWWAWMEHDGPSGHELLTGTEQCECGQMAIGIVEPEVPR